MRYLGIIAIVWSGGPAWAAGDWCAALGEMARATVAARDAGVPMETCLRNVATADASEAARSALRAQVYAAYHGHETPDQARVRAVRICREAQAAVIEDVRRRDAGLPPRDP